MPAQNYVLLERIELNASAASVTFSNIPQSGYTDLKLVMSTRTNSTDTPILMYFNTDTTNSNYTVRRLFGSGSAASSASFSVPYVSYADVSTYTANTFSNDEIYIPNYASSNRKSYSVDAVNENNATGADSALTAGLWSGASGTSAINRIVLNTVSGSFVANSTFSLYGLAAVGTTPTIAPKASGGNIYTDGTYWYHTFLSTGTFTTQTGLTCDVLTIAGGGGGGTTQSSYGGTGGGGAGGVLGFNAQSLTGSYNVVIGSGGAGGASGSTVGSNGSNSQFGSLTASIGGGGGGGATASLNGSGANGGSGGGGESFGTSGGTGTSGQGFNGGNGKGGPQYVGGGGGGAGGAGTSGSVSGAGAGGAGVNTYTNATWLGTALSLTGLGVSGFIAGGGGGGGYSPAAGGTATGGGGAGATNGGANASNGTVNSGGGGGGATGTGTLTGGAGGSGVVIVRYLAA